MQLPRFEYLRASTLKEACSLLNKHKRDAKGIAGGTALLIYLKQRLLTPKYIVGIKRISGLDYIDYNSKTGLRIGCLATIHSLNVSSIIREKYTILSQAAGLIGVPQLRYVGTLGGNLCLDTRCVYYNQSSFSRKVRPTCLKMGGALCHAVKGSKRCYAVYQGDLAPALMALGAKVRLVRNDSERVIPIERFFTGDGEKANILEPEEILAEVQIPPLPHSTGAYSKLRIRGAMDFPLAGVGVVLKMQDKETCLEARIIVNAVSPAPMEVSEAEIILSGKKISDDLVNKAAQEVFRRTSPVANLSLTPGYRREMVKVLFEQSVRQALGAVKHSFDPGGGR